MSNTIKSKNVINDIFSIGIAVLPFLYILNFNIFGFEFDRLYYLAFALLVMAYAILNKTFQVSENLFLFIIVYCGYVTWNSIFFSSCGVIGIATIWLVFLFGILGGKTYIVNFELTKKAIIGLSVVASLIIIVQTILYYTLNYYWSVVPLSWFKPELQEGYASLKYSQTSVIGLFRPSAFFLEPSHFSQYCLVGLAFSLFDNTLSSVKKAVIIALGLVLSTSGIGIVYGAVLFVIYFFARGILNKKNFKYLVFGCVAIIIFYFVLDKIGVVDLLKIRFASTGKNSGILGRLGDLKYVFYDFSFRDFLIGRGYGGALTNESNFLPAFFRWIYQLGLIGIGLLGIITAAIWNKTDICGKIIILVFILLSMMASVSVPAYLFFYLGTAYYCEKNNPS